MSRFDRLFSPRSVAVIGATDREGTYAHNTLLNLARAGFAGTVIGVHPTRDVAAGIPCVPSLRAAGSVDAVVVATPAQSVPAYLREARELGCGGAIVYAAGFAEAGNVGLQADLTDAADDMPVIGPNCNGLVSVTARAPLWGDAVNLPQLPGGVCLVSESGNVGVVGMAHRGGLGLHTAVSTGNAAAVSTAEIVEYLAVQEGIGAIALYLEADGDGAAWCRAFAACAERDVRIVVLKVGRSAKGAAVGAAHTAAIVGDHGVFAALVREAGGVLVRQPLELLETARALALGRRDPRGVGILTCSGGDAGIAADLAEDFGVRLAELSVETSEALRELLPPAATVANPLDHTALVWEDTEAISALTEAVGRDSGVGHLVYIQDEPPGLPQATVDEWRATRAGGVLGGERSGHRTLLVATTPGQAADGVVAGLDNALRALAVLQERPPDPERLRSMADIARHADSRPALAEDVAKSLLAHYGLCVPRGLVVDTASQAVDAAYGLGLDVVLKVVRAGLLHKSEVGGVVLDARTPDQVREAADALLCLAPGDRVLVEERAPAGLEVLIAAQSHGVVPTVTIGLGGLWAEALADIVVVPLPADARRIRRAIRDLRAWPLLSGARGGPVYDVDGLAEAAAAVSRVLLEEELSIVEVNPLILGTAKSIAVDAVIS